MCKLNNRWELFPVWCTFTSLGRWYSTLCNSWVHVKEQLIQNHITMVLKLHSRCSQLCIGVCLVIVEGNCNRIVHLAMNWPSLLKTSGTLSSCDCIWDLSPQMTEGLCKAHPSQNRTCAVLTCKPLLAWRIRVSGLICGDLVINLTIVLQSCMLGKNLPALYHAMIVDQPFRWSWYVPESTNHSCWDITSNNCGIWGCWILSNWNTLDWIPKSSVHCAAMTSRTLGASAARFIYFSNCVV